MREHSEREWSEQNEKSLMTVDKEATAVASFGCFWE